MAKSNMMGATFRPGGVHAFFDVPSQQGVLNYLTVGQEDLNDAVARAEAAGTQILLPKTSLGENGYCAWILDTEGNRIGLHSMR